MISTVTVSLTEVKKSLGEVVNRAAYGGERIVLVSRGKPKAALLSIKDLQLLGSLANERALRRVRRREALAEADALREAILARQGGVPLPNSVEDLRQLRGKITSEVVKGGLADDGNDQSHASISGHAGWGQRSGH